MKSYDVIVAGSGIVGVATAYELAKNGRKVALVDAEGLGAGASTANTSMLLLEGNMFDVTLDLQLAAIPIYEQLASELGSPVDFRKLITLQVFHDADEKKIAAPLAQYFSQRGVRADIVDNAELHDLEPLLCLDTVRGALVVHQWQIDPLKTIFAYFKRSRELGLDWYSDSPVIDFLLEKGRLIGIKTPAEDFFCDQLVVATGAWTRPLLQKLEISIPEYYIHGTGMVTERGEYGVRNAVYAFTSPRIQMQEEAGKQALEKGWENLPMQQANEHCVVPDTEGNLLISQRSHIASSFSDRYPTSYIRDMAENTQMFFPSLRGVKVLRTWIKPVPFTPDDNPFMGFVDPYPNLFVSSGYASALIIAPVVAKITERMLRGEESPCDISAYAPLRFASEEKRM